MSRWIEWTPWLAVSLVLGIFAWHVGLMIRNWLKSGHSGRRQTGCSCASQTGCGPAGPAGNQASPHDCQPGASSRQGAGADKAKEWPAAAHSTGYSRSSGCASCPGCPSYYRCQPAARPKPGQPGRHRDD